MNQISILLISFLLLACNQRGQQSPNVVQPKVYVETETSSKSLESVDQVVEEENGAVEINQATEEQVETKQELVEPTETNLIPQKDKKVGSKNDGISPVEVNSSVKGNKAADVSKVNEPIVEKVQAVQETKVEINEKPVVKVPDAIVEETPQVDEQGIVEEKVAKSEQDGRRARTKPDHYDMDRLLQKFVSNSGMVDYAGIKANPKLLDDFIWELENYPIKADWKRNDKLCYWVNAYNAYTIKMIVDNYPLNSITDLENGKPWDKKWIQLDGKTYSLNQIENEIIRPQFNDPRIHFALNCAAISCPPLHNQAYLPKTIEQMMEKQTKKFINDPNQTKISANQITISKIFDWYSADFGDIHAYLSKYYSGTVPKANINYSEYNWALNKK